MDNSNNLFLALIFITFATLSYAVMGVFTKLALPHTPVTIVVFIRFLFLFLCMMPVLATHGKSLFKTDKLWLQVLRGVVGVLGISLTFIPIQYIPLATVILLSSTDPIFIPFILRIFRGVKIIPKLYIGIIVGLIGVALILHPRSGYFHYAALLALGAGVCRAITLTAMRTLTKTDSTKTIMFYFFMFGTFFSGIASVSSWHGMSEWSWGWMVGVGAASFFFQLFLTQAFRYAPARIMAPFNYLAVVFAALVDWILWDQGMSWLTISGIILTIFGAILTILLGREIIKRKRAA